MEIQLLSRKKRSWDQKSFSILQLLDLKIYVCLKLIIAFPEIITTSISKVDIDLRANLFQHILLAGGNTLFKGLPEKITNEVKKLAPKHMKVNFSYSIRLNYMLHKIGNICVG
jgi:actin-related protein